MGILKKAKELSSNSNVMVFGKPSSGKSTAVVQALAGKNVLWVAFANTNGLEAKHAAEWDVARPVTWKEAKDDLVAGVITGRYEGYNAVVIDGLHIPADMCLNHISLENSSSVEPSIDEPLVIQQNYWLIMGRSIQNMLALLNSKIGSVYVTVDVLPNAEGVYQIDLNRDLFGRIISQFGSKWYTYARPTDKGEIDYRVEKNSARAIRMQPATG